MPAAVSVPLTSCEQGPLRHWSQPAPREKKPAKKEKKGDSRVEQSAKLVPRPVRRCAASRSAAAAGRARDRGRGAQKRGLRPEKFVRCARASELQHQRRLRGEQDVAAL